MNLMTYSIKDIYVYIYTHTHIYMQGYMDLLVYE